MIKIFLKTLFLVFCVFFKLELNAQNINCSLAIPFNDNNCILFSPPTAGPITRCYSFYLADDSVDFNFIPFAPVGTCEDAISWYTLYDSNCDTINTNLDGNFQNLIENNDYTICYTIQCPTDGVINLICSYELITLPIELIYFNARIEYNNIRLLWETATEINNDYFTIYHSSDFINWLRIGSVQGAGNSSQPLLYNFLYNKPSEGVNYFKLQQIDFDGKTTEFNIIAVYFINKNKPNDIFQKYNILGQQIKQ
jgi:hypothetical protein